MVHLGAEHLGIAMGVLDGSDQEHPAKAIKVVEVLDNTIQEAAVVQAVQAAKVQVLAPHMAALVWRI
jgi:hypothetical protein